MLSFFAKFINDFDKARKLEEDKYNKSENFSTILTNIRSLTSIERDGLNRIFSPQKKDILGYKKLIVMMPHLVNHDFLSRSIVRVIVDSKDSFGESEFYKWFENFGERVLLELCRLGIHGKRSTNKNETKNRLLSLSNLELIYLRKFFLSLEFDQFIYNGLALQRVKIIFSRDDMRHHLSNYTSAGLYSLTDMEIDYYLSTYLKLKASLKSLVVPLSKIRFFYDVLDFSSRSYLKCKLSEKSTFELCYIMLELKDDYRIKLYKLLNNYEQKKVKELISDNKIELRDAKIISKFIREIEKDYFKGKFSLLYN